MRFKKCQIKAEKREITTRRISRSKLSIQRQANKLPLFAEQIKDELGDPTERLKKIDKESREYLQRLRDYNAKSWRKGRGALESFDEDARKQILNEWKLSPLPGSPEYFCDFLWRKKILL